jgi:hypothetical protein
MARVSSWSLRRIMYSSKRNSRGSRSIARSPRLAGVARKTIVLIEADENDQMDPRRLKVLQSLQRVFEDEYGIEFFAASENSGEGVRFRKT